MLEKCKQDTDLSDFSSTDILNLVSTGMLVDSKTINQSWIRQKSNQITKHISQLFNKNQDMNIDCNDNKLSVLSFDSMSICSFGLYALINFLN